MKKARPGRPTGTQHLTPALAVLLLVLSSGQMLVIGLQPACG